MAECPFVETIEAQSWHVFDITDDLIRRKIRGWDELARAGAAQKLLTGHEYIFAPQPKEGQSQRDAYMGTGGVGPSLRIRDYEDPAYEEFALTYSRGRVMMSRIALRATGVGVYLLGPHKEISDAAFLPQATASETFARDFEVISPSQFHHEVAISNIIVPTMVQRGSN